MAIIIAIAKKCFDTVFTSFANILKIEPNQLLPFEYSVNYASVLSGISDHRS